VSYTPTPEAVEAAARELVPGDWRIVPERSMIHYRSDATKALIAAAPFMRDALLEELSQLSGGLVVGYLDDDAPDENGMILFHEENDLCTWLEDQKGGESW
jgi:hypothetical protein